MINKNKILKNVSRFLVVSGILFWVICLSLILPISPIMGWVGLFGFYWYMFGLPLALTIWTSVPNKLLSIRILTSII